MTHWVYILQSQSSGRHYCGQNDDIKKRLNQHNDPENTFTRTASRFKGPWRLIHKIECPNRTDANRLERKIRVSNRGEAEIPLRAGLIPPAVGLWPVTPQA
jgi:putative endonuclease